MIIKTQNTPLSGLIKIPGDKSISHRILMLASQIEAVTEIHNLSSSIDVKRTSNILKILGVKITKRADIYRVHGSKLGSNFIAPNKTLYMGNSGTSCRLLMGLLGSHAFTYHIKGDKSLSSRPMRRVMEPLSMMGIDFKSANYLLPCIMQGKENLSSISYHLAIASAQVKSAILLAAINIVGTTKINGNLKSRDHTELMLDYMGADILIGDNQISINGGKELKSIDKYVVAGDPSSAAFLVVACLCIPGSHIIIRDVNINHYRTGIYDVLIQMGADIKFCNYRVVQNEKIADIEVRYSKLVGVEISSSVAPSLIDEYPILSVACAHADGVTRILGVGELKYKESNRLEAICSGLTKCGVKVEYGDDWYVIHGTNQNITGDATIRTMGDHRIAMAFTILGMISSNPIVIDEVESIKTSFPEFFDKLKEIGYSV